MNVVNDELLCELTDCESLDEIKVLSLRNKQLTQCVKHLTECTSLNILYLQNNMLGVKDLGFL